MDPSSSTPLADYFWIAGVENFTHDDGPLPSPQLQQQQQLEDTIAEDGEDESANDSVFSSSTANRDRPATRHSRQNSGGGNRLSALSKMSFVSDNRPLDELDGNTRSNRSSATIRAVNPPFPVTTTSSSSGNANGAVNCQPHAAGGVGVGVGIGIGLGGQDGFLGDFDFDSALVKFAAERENFLDDLSFSAGAKLQARPPMVNLRAEKLRTEDAADLNGKKSPLRSIKGSIRRKISFRDMTSTRSRPSVNRAASVRTAKRISNYNSVIPPPEPLNADPDMHPLKRHFEPVLLDRYPPRDASPDELSRRGKFPDYVPMFAFPNDIQIVSSDDRPRTTWHGFTMTSDDNSKIYGITIIVWTALNADVAEVVEKRCERWRQSHMSNEERELAASLGVRLAAERAHLSQLLAKLGSVPSGTAQRDALDDQISAVEEKISLMTEMLRPLRHGAASKIDGLTDGETGLWAPRAYGVLGRDSAKMAFWKEWLKAVVVPMTDGAILRVPATSPRVGRWQPLERYIVNLCTEALSPLCSKTQVELGVRELRLYARKEALNELPGSRNTDLYALFRCLSIENIMLLFEYALSESRIIFLSSHAGMLHLACHALASLLYPFKWASIFIPVLPARLLSALEAPCPYIVGVERRYERIDLPEEDFVLVDLDRDLIESTSQHVPLPKQHRRKLLSLLQVAAPHRLRYGVTAGAPPYAMEAFPYDAFSAENPGLFHPNPAPTELGKWVTQNSSTFGDPDAPELVAPPLFNAFARAKIDPSKSERPPTGKSGKGSSPPSSVSPQSVNFPPMPTTPVSRSDSGFAVSAAATLKEKRSGHFEIGGKSRRSSSFGMDVKNTLPPAPHAAMHRPSLPHLNGHGHGYNMSISAMSVDSKSSYGGYGPSGYGNGGYSGGGYAPSTYAQSTIAASTIMPHLMMQPVRNTETTVWVEGHCFEWTAYEDLNSRPISASMRPGTPACTTCTVCEDRSEGDGLYRCFGCGCLAHGRCLGCVSLVCPEAFHADRVRAAFVRCLASLLYTYRKYLGRVNREQKNAGQLHSFDMDGFIRSLPYDQQEYTTMLKSTQAFNEFIHERERLPASHPDVRLFDEIILAKKARGRPAFSAGLSRLSTIRASHGASIGHMSGMPSAASLSRSRVVSQGALSGPGASHLSSHHHHSSSSSSSSSSNHSSSASNSRVPSYLSDRTDHLWRTASVPLPSAKNFPGDYRTVITRVPARLDSNLMREPRAIQGVPRPAEQQNLGGRIRGLVRKQVPSMLGMPGMGFGTKV